MSFSVFSVSSVNSVIQTENMCQHYTHLYIYPLLTRLVRYVIVYTYLKNKMSVILKDFTTTTRSAYIPETGEKYQILVPALEEIRKAILEIVFPPKGMTIAEAKEKLTVIFDLSEEQINAKIISKNHYIDQFYYLVAQAFRNLKKHGKIVQPGGDRTPYFLAQDDKLDKDDTDVSYEDGPEEHIEDKFTVDTIDEMFHSIHKRLAIELLDEIKNNTPAFFEELVIDLLVTMGYGGSREDAEAVGRSGDGGIDGIINEDRLGLDVVYVQAKRWETNIGEPPVRDFVGAIDGKGAQKGIFITTSEFNSSAEKYAERSSKNIVLINGQQLAQFMIDHDVGVSTSKTYEIKKVDSDYFAEE